MMKTRNIRLRRIMNRHVYDISTFSFIEHPDSVPLAELKKRIRRVHRVMEKEGFVISKTEFEESPVSTGTYIVD